MTGTWCVYLLRCADGTYYTGMTNDVVKRVNRHNEGKGAKYTRGRRPVRLIWARTYESRADACAEEARVKRLKKQYKPAYGMDTAL